MDYSLKLRDERGPEFLRETIFEFAQGAMGMGPRKALKCADAVVLILEADLID